MKTLKTILLGSLALLFVGACQNEEIDQQSITLGENETLVEFNLNADAISKGSLTRTFSPTYTPGNFQIYAFKESGNEFKYFKTINTAGMSYDKDKQLLTGQAVVQIGAYKFLTLYGTGSTQTGLKTVNWSTSTTLQDAVLEMEGKLNMEIFLPIEKESNGDYKNMEDALTTYYFKVDENTGDPNEAPNPVVTEKLYRAVSRVDILFVSAKRIKDAQGNVISVTEQPYTGDKVDILGADIESIKFEFTNVNKGMSYIGDPTVGSSSNLDLTLTDLKKGDGGKITIGDHASATEVGESGYLSYDNVLPEHIISKGAHIFGPYLFPNQTTAATTSLKMTINGKDIEVPRVITPKDIPLEQNKVTIIKIRVIQDGDTPPPSLFETTIDFEVEVITDWLGSNVIIEEIG